MKEILEYVGLSNRGHSYEILKNRFKLEGIEFKTNFSKIISESSNYTLETIFCENSSYCGDLKKKLLDNKIVSYSCSICNNNGIHCDKKLSLQIDHINGISNDNRLTNLRLLCPNCHSQTDTYSGKKSNTGPVKRNEIPKYKCSKCLSLIGKTKNGMCSVCYNVSKRLFNPDINELNKLLIDNTITDVAKYYNVSIAAIKKRIKILK